MQNNQISLASYSIEEGKLSIKVTEFTTVGTVKKMEQYDCTIGVDTIKIAEDVKKKYGLTDDEFVNDILQYNDRLLKYECDFKEPVVLDCPDWYFSF